MKLRYVMLCIVLSVAGTMVYRKAPSSSGRVHLTADQISNRRQTIRFYEGSIRNLERQRRLVYRVKTNGDDETSPVVPQVNGRIFNPAEVARSRQIADYQQRIAKMKEEIGE